MNLSAFVLFSLLPGT